MFLLLKLCILFNTFHYDFLSDFNILPELRPSEGGLVISLSYSGGPGFLGAQR